MYEKKIPKAFDCGMSVTLEIIGGKWKPCLIDSISKGIRRPSELQKRHSAATSRVLNLHLKELREHGVVTKVIFPELPIKVEYFLTELGKSLLPLISHINSWGDEHMSTFQESQHQKVLKSR